MEDGIECGGEWLRAPDEIGVGPRPHGTKLVDRSRCIPRMAMPGGQRSGFVEEEEFGVVAGRHDDVPAAFEFQHADDPALKLIRTPDVLMLVVQAAAIAEQRAARGCWR